MTTVIKPLLCNFYVIGTPCSLQSKKSKSAWKNLVQLASRDSMKEILSSDIKLEIQIDWFSKGYQNKPDTDNIQKPILDSMKNIVYADDNQVKTISASHHDVDSILFFNDEPIKIIEPLLSGTEEYVYIRIYRIF